MTKYFVLILVCISALANAQTASELSSHSLTLPRLSTAQQYNLPPQQAGNLIYNTDENKLAVHNGTDWNFISGLSASSYKEFTSHKIFFENTIFQVPFGINKMLIEIWGNGASGQVLSSVGANVPCSGGGGGQYIQASITVAYLEDLYIFFDDFVNMVRRNNVRVAAASHASGSMGGEGIVDLYTNIITMVSGQNGKTADFSFQQANAGIYRKIVKSGAGGGTYPTFANGGHGITMEFDVNSGTLIGTSKGQGYEVFGKFPGGGGGCTNQNINTGAQGAIILHY